MRSPGTGPGTIVLSLVERGWQAAREYSLDVQREGGGVVHLVKGALSPAVHAMIAPQPRVRVVSVRRALFWPLAWAWCAGLLAAARLRGVLVDNERSLRRVRRWVGGPRVRLVRVGPGGRGYELAGGS
ncbi:MAG: hypothetical protein HYT90_00950 [Candidatus Omnitrophica bacterium]|nr:hypothetical protein [Candidatus Omnitrophota bacterium]